MMMRKGMMYIALLLAIFVLAGCYRSPEQRAERVVNRIAGKLDLDEQQKAKLSSIKDEIMAKRPEMGKMRDEIFEEVISLMESDKIDDARLNAAADKVEKHIAGDIRFFSEKFKEFHDMLTPEQRAKVVEKIKKMREHHKGGHY